jgi:hypothetical protein
MKKTIKPAGAFAQEMKSVMKSIKKLFTDEEQKDFTMTTAAGDEISIADPDGDGKPMAGDIVTDDEGNILANGEIEMQDGTTIHTDENGAITAIDPKEVEPGEGNTPPAVDPAAKSDKEQAAEWKKKYEDEVAAHLADNETATKTVNSLADRLKKLKSAGNPKTSGTTFKGEGGKKQNSEEYKSSIQELHDKRKGKKTIVK